MLKKFIVLFSLTLTVLTTGVFGVAFAQDSDRELTRTLLPEANKERFRSNYDCTNLMKTFEDIYFFAEDEAISGEVSSVARFYQTIRYMNEGKEGAEKFAANGDNDPNVITGNDILGCSLVTGRISLSYLTMFISYALRLTTILAGTVSMIFIIIGGYRYVIAGVTESQDSAKNTIRNAIIGLAVSTGAWIIVNIILALQTGA